MTLIYIYHNLKHTERLFKRTCNSMQMGTYEVWSCCEKVQLLKTIAPANRQKQQPGAATTPIKANKPPRHDSNKRLHKLSQLHIKKPHVIFSYRSQSRSCSLPFALCPAACLPQPEFLKRRRGFAQMCPAKFCLPTPSFTCAQP